MNLFTRMWVLTHMLVFCVAFCRFSVWYSIFLIFFAFLLFIYALFSFLILKSSLAFLITSHPSVTSVISHVPLFFHPKSDFSSKSFVFFLPFIPPLLFSVLIRLSQCVPRALAYTNQICLLVLEHRRKEFHKHTGSVTHTHMDYILFLSTTEHGFDSPTTASTGCVKDSSKQNAKSEFVQVWKDDLQPPVLQLCFNAEERW